MSKKKKPIRMLVWGDTPDCATGFATVTRNIFSRLAKKNGWIIDFIGVNDLGGWKDPKVYGKNMRIYPALTMGSSDVFGRGRLVNAFLLKDRDLTPPWDLVFTLNDPFILEAPTTKWGAGTLNALYDFSEGYKEKFPPEWWFKIISYWPIDSELKENWYEEAIAKCHYPVAYTDFGAEEIRKIEKRFNKSQLKGELKTIYHGVDTNIFFPVSKEEKDDFRKQFFQDKVSPETFLVSLVCRNQPRKDIPRAMMAFKQFKQKRPDSFLYIHAKQHDAGGSLTEYAKFLGLKEGKDWGFPSRFSEHKGYPLEAVNMIYNTSDCIMSTTLGEGFGLPFFEAMAAHTINIAPDNTTVPELFNIEVGTDHTRLKDEDYIKKIRGVGVKSGSTQSEFMALGVDDKERFRPLTNVEDMVKKLTWIHDNPDKVAEIEDRALEWVQQYTWGAVAKQWEELFLKAYSDLEEERKTWKPKKGQTKGIVPDKITFKVGKEDKEKKGKL